MKYCTNCGTEIIEGQTECGNCFQSINDMNTPTTVENVDQNLNVENSQYVQEQKNPSNTSALIAIILTAVTLVMPIVAIPAVIFGIIGYSKSRKLNGEGRGISIVAMIIPTLYFLFYIFIAVFIAMFFMLFWISAFFDIIFF
ncbi:MAG: hypothetical protein ACRC5M_00315 [Anaeroplasmataceae bacterium]